jgi:uncharacterized membrane protein YedE/YeeE
MLYLIIFNLKRRVLMNFLKKASWSPITVGVSIGILTWIVFLFMLKMLDITTPLVHFIGFIIGIFSIDHVAYTPYLSAAVEFKPVVDWQFALAIGIFIGAFISAWRAKVTFSDIPVLWGNNMGYLKKTRIIGAIIGGFLIAFGAQLAGGCSLAHGISGGLQFGTLSWLFIITVAISGAITAHILYKNK